MPAGIRKPMSDREMVRTRTKFNIAQSDAWLRKRGYKYNVKRKKYTKLIEKKYKKKTSMKAKTKTKAYHERKARGIKKGIRDNASVKYV